MREINFVSNVHCRMAPIEELEPAYDPLETSMLGEVVDKRRREFHAGRHIARTLIADAGRGCVSIPIDDNRLPHWPRGLCGSISHTATHVAAAVAPTSGVAGIGLDIEKCNAVEPSLYPLVLLENERKRVERCGIDPTIYFSCKEAVYKAVFPIFFDEFEFTDIMIDLSGTRFVARAATHLHGSRRAIEKSIGYCCLIERHVVTLFVMP